MFCTYTHETQTFHSDMRAPTYWAEAVTKRGGRAPPPLNVQLFDPLEPGLQKDAERRAATCADVYGSILLYWRQESDPEAVHGLEQCVFGHLE